MSSSSFFGVVVSNATVVKKCRRRRRRRRRRTRRRVFFSLFPRHEIVSFQDRGVVDLVMIGQIESSKKKIRKSVNVVYVAVSRRYADAIVSASRGAFRSSRIARRR